MRIKLYSFSFKAISYHRTCLNNTFLCTGPLSLTITFFFHSISRFSRLVFTSLSDNPFAAYLLLGLDELFIVALPIVKSRRKAYLKWTVCSIMEFIRELMKERVATI